jgi:hypothetical protein
MRQLPYRAFLWIFSVSNAVVWFGILYGLGYFMQTRFAIDGRVDRRSAVTMVCVALLLPTVLALQGAIVNFRVQFIGGRFAPPAHLPGTRAAVHNPWSAATVTAMLFWVVGVPVLAGGLRVLLPSNVGASRVAIVMAGVGALVILILVRYITDRDLRHYVGALDVAPATQVPMAAYVIGRIALPWGAVNAVINAALAWMMYRQGPMHPAAMVSVDELRGDLVVMSFLISVFMALSALPEAETDCQRRFVRATAGLPLMPRLWTRYGYALGVALAMHIVLTATAAACGISQISLGAMVLIKGVTAGLVAAGAAGMCAVWALSRCAQRVASPGTPVAEPARAM